MEERELDFSDVLSAIRKWFLLILLFIILGGSASAFYNYGAPIRYQSTTTLYVQPQVTASEVDYQGILTNQRMVKTYVQIMKSRKVIEKVNEKLELNQTYDEFLNNTSITSSDDTQMISISVKSVDKESAASIANTFASTFIEEIKESMNITNIVVVDEAVVNSNPVEPRIVYNYAIGIGLGAIIGLILAFLLDSMDNKIKNHEDVKKFLKIKTLGVVPDHSIDAEIKNKKKVYVKPNEIDIKILTDPTSVVSESMRMIRTNLNFMDLKLINIISTLPSEGKSEVVTNLAAAFALLDKKVLVMDCDLRKPKIHKNFGLFRKNGVSDIVLSKGTVDYKTAIQKFESKNVTIDVLTAGSKISNPSELINSEHFANLLKQVKEDYDLVLVDCPPISSLTDGVLVSKLADGTVYVIESDRIDKPIIQECIEELQSNKAFILGAILTKVNVKTQKKLYGYKYDYYYSNYHN